MRAEKMIFFLVGMLCLIGSLSAQQTAITGKIMDASNRSPVAFANVLLLDPDSVFITGASSNLDGDFTIEEQLGRGCFLSVSYIGYETAYTEVHLNELSQPLDILLQPSSIALNEVTVQAHSVIVKDDRKIILPTQEQIRTSTDGTDILRKMQLPRIMVDVTTGEISMSGNGEIQLRINGVEVTQAELASIPPADILRIEYHDDPGARYGNADAVINYITRRHESGGNVNGSFFNGIKKNRIGATNRIAAKYSNGKSEFSANAMYVQRKQAWSREYDEKLIFPDHELHRLEIGEPTFFNKKIVASNFTYSLMESGKYFFNLQLKYNLNDFPNGYEDRKSLLYTSASDTPLSVFDHTFEKSHSPSLDLYYQRDLQNDQLLVFNLVGTYIDTESKRIYQEKQEDIFRTDILSEISGNKYSLIAEGIYEKKLGTHKITGGMKHLQAYTDNEYRGSTIADVSMRQAETSLYAEYQGRSGKWGYMANLTGVRLYYSQKGSHTEKYALQPSARITFEPDRDLYFRYRIHLRNNAPSLATLNDVEQPVDTWQVCRGNPDLKAFNKLTQLFTAAYNKGWYGVDLLINYDHEYDPIMESLFYENGKFVYFYENQRSFQNLRAEATFKVKPWKEYINLSLTPGLNRFISKGNDYTHTYTMYELRVDLDVSYNNWIGNFATITPPRSVYGEQLIKNKQMYNLMVGYKAANWSLMMGALNPFTKEYKTENRNWSALNPVWSKIHTNNNKSFLLKLNFNINYGKQFRGNNKRVHNIDTDSGIMQGLKQ